MHFTYDGAMLDQISFVVNECGWRKPEILYANHELNLGKIDDSCCRM